MNASNTERAVLDLSKGSGKKKQQPFGEEQ